MPPSSPSKRISPGAVMWRATAFALVWWSMAEGRADSWGVGGVSVGLAVAASLALVPPGRARLSLGGLMSYLGFFLGQSLRGGLQVAARAFRPRMDLCPALVDVPVTLPEGLPRVVLVNTLNLLPGTVSVRLEGDCLRLHALDARMPVAEEVRRAEARIARLWGIPS